MLGQQDRAQEEHADEVGAALAVAPQQELQRDLAHGIGGGAGEQVAQVVVLELVEELEALGLQVVAELAAESARRVRAQVVG